MTLKVRFRHFLTTCVTICESQIKKYFYFTDFLTKMKPLLTHVHKTPPLRSHYGDNYDQIKISGQHSNTYDKQGYPSPGLCEKL